MYTWNNPKSVWLGIFYYNHYMIMVNRLQLVAVMQFIHVICMAVVELDHKTIKSFYISFLNIIRNSFNW